MVVLEGTALVVDSDVVEENPEVVEDVTRVVGCTLVVEEAKLEDVVVTIPRL